MGIDANWHVDGRLSILTLFPENGGCVVLTDDSRATLTLFLDAQWIDLYRVLPLAPNAWLATYNMPHIHDIGEIEAWVAASKLLGLTIGDIV